MAENTGERLVEAAASLLDGGGIQAVTIRAVAERVGVSHNAHSRHFKDRAALLAAVGARDFAMLTGEFERAGRGRTRPITALKAATKAFIAYGRSHPARYRLLFSDPDIASSGGALEQQATAAFAAFSQLVRAAQHAGDLPPIDPIQLTAILYATLHGLVDIELGGRARAAKGLGDIQRIADLLLEMISTTR